MAIKILKRGVLPDEKNYSATCRSCKSSFSFQIEDAKYVSPVTPTEWAYLSINCPICDKLLYFAI